MLISERRALSLSRLCKQSPPEMIVRDRFAELRLASSRARAAGCDLSASWLRERSSEMPFGTRFDELRLASSRARASCGGALLASAGFANILFRRCVSDLASMSYIASTRARAAGRALSLSRFCEHSLPEMPFGSLRFAYALLLKEAYLEALQIRTRFV